MLLLLCGVCAWFWGPLIFPKDESKAKGTKTGAAATVAAPEATKAVAAVPAIDWKLLAERLTSDPYMHGAPPRTTKPGETPRNPFGAPVLPPVEPTADELELLAAELEAEEMRAEQETKQKLQLAATEDVAAWKTMSLELSSTFVGARARKAVINGRAFAEGAVIGKLGTAEIRLTSVTPRNAVLTWNGVPRELRIPRPGESPPPEASAAAESGAASELNGLELEPETIGTEGLEPAAASAL